MGIRPRNAWIVTRGLKPALYILLLFSAIPGHAVDGAPVINGIPIVVKLAEMAVKLRRLAGLGVSRVSDYVQPPIEILEEFLTHPKGL
jgi:hypothetical protein